MDSFGLGRTSYENALKAQAVGCERGRVRVFWFEADPVFTLGLRAEPVGELSEPVLKVNRGGAATYHGPGQLVIFPAVHLPSVGFSVRRWVEFLLGTTCACLAEFGIEAQWSASSPGVYTSRGKIASVGLKIENGWTRHGLALNVNMNLEPFSRIRTCGVAHAELDQMSHWLANCPDLAAVSSCWLRHFSRDASPISL